MLIPYNTDAAIYHRPFATIGLIGANAIAFFLLSGLFDSHPEIVEELILEYGQGLRPWQWITSNFVHAGWMHLLGNMFCLWGFGLVVEGKIGWWRMLAVYFAIGVGQCAAEQAMMLFSDGGGSCGASSIVYGLLAMCLIWSPENEMECVLLLGPPRLFEAKLSMIASMLFFIEIATGIFSGLAISSQLLHLMGGATGLGLGIVMLRKGWVDCEGWDLFSVLRGRPRQEIEEDRDAVRKLLDDAHQKRLANLGSVATVNLAAPSRPPQPATTTAGGKAKAIPVAAPQASSAQRAALPAKTVQAPGRSAATVDPARQAIHAALRAGDPVAAFQAYRAFTTDLLNGPPPELELLHIIAAFQRQNRWADSIAPMVEYLQNHRARAVEMRLKLAHILLTAVNRPAQALQVLSKLPSERLSAGERETFSKLVSHAQSRKLTKPSEPPVENW